VDREAIARAGRRREVLDMLAFEQQREIALREQIEAVVLEEDRARLDGALKALLRPDELELLDDVFAEPMDDDDLLDEDEPQDRDANEAEIARLREEVTRSQARQRALERLSAMLDSKHPGAVSETARETAL
jgi:hypothetical protein